MTHDEMIAVIQAHKDGKKIAYRTRNTSGDWFPAISLSWSFSAYDYRVVPEPRSFQVGYDETGKVVSIIELSRGDCTLGFIAPAKGRVEVVKMQEVL